jgi:hypothetical protein
MRMSAGPNVTPVCTCASGEADAFVPSGLKYNVLFAVSKWKRLVLDWNWSSPDDSNTGVTSLPGVNPLPKNCRPVMAGDRRLHQPEAG